MSWFLGKKFKRVRCENIDELLNSTNASEEVIRFLKGSPPTISFTKIDDINFMFTLEADKKHHSYMFKVGEVNEVQRRDGSKIEVLYQLESDNIMKQTIRMPHGKTACFTREFSETGAKMTVELEGSSIKGTIYYEVVE
ncbi:unnamed protein product [Parnassius mnemosyne]|uniref:Uncharacterized protein n=1 Tax=Parnassius mnemosyne TaxID=213953 RepID=A0AAV1LMT2_9NEOP